MRPSMSFPDGRRFAFTILDDTDDSTLENVRPVYERLREYGLRTTKTVWPLDCPEGSREYFAADTLARPEYLAFVHELVDWGFELASHGATMESSLRERTERGITFLEREFGHCPRLHANHGQNRENLYWGAERFQSGWIRPWIRLLAGHGPGSFSGEREDSSYYWGDLAFEHYEYVRNFTFAGLDLLRFDPHTPYRLEGTPCVRYWFSSTDAPNAEVFRRRLTRQALDRLASEGGVCIVSTHLGKGFVQDGRLDPEIDGVLRHLAGLPGWYVPVSTLLDHLRSEGAGQSLDGLALLRLELRFLFDQLTERLRELVPKRRPVS